MSTPAEQNELKKILAGGAPIVPVLPPPPMPPDVRDALVTLGQRFLKVNLTPSLESWQQDWERWRQSISVGQ